MMYEIERAIPTPQVEIIIQRRARRQVFRDGPPLTTGGENVHETVHNLAQDNTAPGHLNREQMEQALALDWNNQGVTQTYGELTEIYMVAEPIWEAAGMEPMSGCLCIGCLETDRPDADAEGFLARAFVQ